MAIHIRRRELLAALGGAATWPVAARAHPGIDSAGFENYTIFCTGRGNSLSGIIDPFDGAFLAEVVE